MLLMVLQVGETTQCSRRARREHSGPQKNLIAVTATATLSAISLRSGKPGSYSVESPTTFLRQGRVLYTAK